MDIISAIAFAAGAISGDRKADKAKDELAWDAGWGKPEPISAGSWAFAVLCGVIWVLVLM